MSALPRDENTRTVLGGLSDVDQSTPRPIGAKSDGTNWALYTHIASSEGNVTNSNSSTLWADDTEATVKRVAISVSSSGDNTLVSAVAGKNIRVLSLFMVVVSEVVVRFEDGAGGTALSGQMTITDHSGLVLSFNPKGWFETSDNTLLNLELGSSVQVSGSLTYIEV